ncbi:NmrA family transcriptional regulator [Pedobacter sp. HMWF019]|uniref:NmrA family NAD(P)-binding protein n=1 Tax=Pedobacter sp. HMWF019 TaxID=2056856 RepID=UPI000D357C31|nr:NmrA family NAD(P)-binding protein [Pedobacter sp. HMWF019]PTT01351.1 NmrA family transcriptional regulator [Pedobacter sp. HMWF019]
MKSKDKLILVLGGTGKTGKRIVENLNQLGLPVRIGSRSAAIPFDWEDRQTWIPALQDVKSIYLSFQPDLAAPGAPDSIREFTALAARNSINKVVLLSGRGEPEAEHCEEIVKQSGLDWTILRASWFAQNFSESFLLHPIRAGHVVLPSGDTKEPFIDANDIAEAAVAALINNEHRHQCHELTGPRLLTFPQAIEEIACALEKPILYEQVSPQAYTDLLRSFEVPEEYISLLDYLFSEVLDGRNAHLTNGLERLLKRKPTDFSEYIKKTIESGVWKS